MRRSHVVLLLAFGLLTVLSIQHYCRHHRQPPVITRSGEYLEYIVAQQVPFIRQVHLSEELRKISFGDFEVSELRDAPLQTLSPLWDPIQLDKAKMSPPPDALTKMLTERYIDTANCSWELSLDMDKNQLQGKKFLIAATFKNNEAVLPHMILQIWHTISLLPEGSVFVSAYENDSTDQTERYLTILKELLLAMKVPHRIIMGKIQAFDKEKKDKRLASQRNVALEPLWPRIEQDPRSRIAGDQSPQFWKADKVIFFNDAFFCAQDIIRLLYSKADMTCGLDFHSEPDEKSGRMYIYDVWVARDTLGEVIHHSPPYFKDKASIKRMQSGLPFPVRSCWNGMAAIRADAFIDHQLRFRTSKGDECFQSECKLICDDLIRLGMGKIVIDPNVRLTYKVSDAHKRFDPELVWGIGEEIWGIARQKSLDWGKIVLKNSTRCCLLDVWGALQFDKCPHYPLFPSDQAS